MKKIISCSVIIILLIISPIFSDAQFNLGISTGAGGSAQSELGNVYLNNGLVTNYHIGILTYYDFNNWLALKSGLSYEGKGGRIDETYTNSNSYTENLSYLMIPVKAQFSAGKKAGFKKGQEIFAASGPYIGYLLHSKNNKTLNDATLNDSPRNTDYGWSFEVGMKFPMSAKNDILFSVNYDVGMAQISKSDKSLRNKTASLNLGIRF